MSDPPRGELPHDVEKAARCIHRVVWNEGYTKGRGPMHHAGGAYWPSRLLRIADSWERMAVAARICSAHMTSPERLEPPLADEATVVREATEK